ncbi:MAG: energy transducer TonB [Bryobacteraceae bacterium]|jgi:TonB family protein
MFRPVVFLILLAGAALGASPDSRGVTVDPGGTLLHRSSVEYPHEAIASGIEGVVVVELDLDKAGEVADARVVSGPEELRRAALRAVLDWHYLPEATSHSKVQAAITFRLDEAIKQAHLARRPLVIPDEPLGTVRGLEIEGLTDPGHEALVARLPFHAGGPLTPELLEKAHQMVSDFDRHLSFSFDTTAEGTTVRIMLPGWSVGALPVPQPGAQQIRVGSNVQSNKLIISPPPVYPPLARQARISGVVWLNALIGTDGHVQHLTVVSGHPLLVPSAMEAVKTWVYEPTLLNGKAVEVVTEIEVNFTLTE